jgi:hypothetical protein
MTKAERQAALRIDVGFTVGIGEDGQGQGGGIKAVTSAGVGAAGVPLTSNACAHRHARTRRNNYAGRR